MPTSKAMSEKNVIVMFAKLLTKPEFIEIRVWK